MTSPNYFYFGCGDETGHYWWYNGKKFYDPPIGPWGLEIDSCLAPLTKSYQAEGACSITHKDGWTALSFWDRSVDKRMGSNSAFVVQGIYEFSEMIAKFKELFPKQHGRLKAELILAKVIGFKEK